MATEISSPNPPAPTSLPAERSGRPSPRNTRRAGRWSAYQRLLWVRLLELKREPEIIFWVFGFPLLLSLGLGVAFRNKPADQHAVAVVAGQNADETASKLGGSSPDKRSSLRAVVVQREAAMKGLRLGKFDVVVEQKGGGTYQFYYDPSRPESEYARLLTGDTLEASVGRIDKLQIANTASSAPGSRYIDFL